MVPTPRLAALAALALAPAAAAIAWAPALWIALGWDALLLTALAIDWARCPRASCLEARREVEDVVGAGAPNRVRLVIESLGERELDGEIADAPPPGAEAKGYRLSFSLPAHARWEASYAFTPASRGDHRFGDLHLRLRGPWGLARRQLRLGAARRVKAYPDLAALAREALTSPRLEQETGLARMRRALAEGRELESLREYLPGDDVRTIDWKATARHQRPITRQLEPERNQTLMLLLDCGRHMVSRVGERTKLDLAVDAALRLARVSLERGDQVGLCAFGAKVKAFLPPRHGRAQLQALVAQLYPLQPELAESGYDEAFGLVASRLKRRALIVAFTDLLDEDTSRELLERTLRLRPRHLPLVVAAADGALLHAARELPQTPEAAYARAAARKILHERGRTVARLLDAGAHVVDVPATAISASAINAYLDIKQRGLL